MDINYLTFRRLLGDQNFISAVNYSLGQIILSILLTFIFALFIYYIYKKTYQGVAYSKNFGLTLIVVSLVASVIVMAISGNLALSLGMIGALSIVRFRSAIKDPRDIAYLFWALTNGVVSGVLIFKLAIVSNLLIGAVILVFARKVIQHQSFLLVISGQSMDRKALRELLDSDCSFSKLRLENVYEERTELHVEVKLKRKKADLGCDELVDKIRKQVSGIEKVTAVSQEGGIEGI